MNPENLTIERANRKRAWAYCLNHQDTNTPNLEICLQGSYRGRCYCWVCGYSDFIPEDYLLDLFGEEKLIKKKTSINWFDLAYSYWIKPKNEFETLSSDWKISLKSLSDFFVGWNGQAYSIPMNNESFRIIGIQLRYPDGFKCCIEGSDLGLFIPCNYWDKLGETLYICEGFSDTVTVHDLGFFTIGRPNDLCCMKMVKDFIKINNIKKIVIVSDNDQPGIDGANKLWNWIGRTNCTIKVPPYKDIRKTHLEKGREFTQNFLNFT